MKGYKGEFCQDGKQICVDKNYRNVWRISSLLVPLPVLICLKGIKLFLSSWEACPVNGHENRYRYGFLRCTG
jgi:hypothetical protein